VFGDPVGDLVGVGLDTLVQVDHGLDHHLGGAVAAAPGPDLLHREQVVAAFEPGDRVEPVQRGFGEVDVQHDLTGLDPRRRLIPSSLRFVGGVKFGVGVQRERCLASGEVTDGPGAAHVQRLL
jgi:hypothetical protein